MVRSRGVENVDAGGGDVGGVAAEVMVWQLRVRRMRKVKRRGRILFFVVMSLPVGFTPVSNAPDSDPAFSFINFVKNPIISNSNAKIPLHAGQFSYSCGARFVNQSEHRLIYSGTHIGFKPFALSICRIRNGDAIRWFSHLRGSLLSPARFLFLREPHQLITNPQGLED